MAKNKFGKFLAFTAVIGAAVAAGAALFLKQKKKQGSSDLDYDDFDDDVDDEDFDFPTPDQEEAIQREYVSLNIETPKSTDESGSMGTESSTVTSQEEDKNNVETSKDAATDTEAFDENK